MLSINGFGTTLYGKRDVHPTDNSYIATKWIILLFVPIIPLGSYRVVKVKQKFLTLDSPRYYMTSVSLHRQQVRNIYLVVWGPVLFIIALTVLAGLV